MPGTRRMRAVSPHRGGKGDKSVSLFDVLVMGHLAGDFLFQTAWMARWKASRWDALLVHAAVYTASVFLAARFDGVTLGLLAAALLLVSHAALDQRRLVRWWARTVGGITRAEDQWLLIVIDQVAHLLILVAVVGLAGQ